MTLRLGDTAPDFEQDSTIGKIRFHEWIGDSWAVLFSHPADYTPVCTTELGLTAKLKSDFEQNCRVDFPIIADLDKKVATLYDMIHPNQSDTVTVRSLFIIDPKKKVRLIITYPLSTGRNFDEVLRVIDALQVTDKYTVAIPGNWKNGDDVIILLTIKDEEVIKQKFPKGYKAPRPYLRIAPQPDKQPVGIASEILIR